MVIVPKQSNNESVKKDHNENTFIYISILSYIMLSFSQGLGDKTRLSIVKAYFDIDVRNSWQY